MADPIDFSILTLSRAMSPALSERVFAEAEFHNYQAGELIESRGALATHISLIHTGMVRLGVDNADGSRFNMSLLGKGNSFGEMAIFLDQVVRHDAHAETDLSLARISKQKVNAMIKLQPDFAVAMLKVSYARFDTLLAYVGDGISSSVEERTVKLILNISRHSEKADEIVCRQIDLSHALGVSRVSIGKVLKRLADDKLVEVGYGKIRLISPTGLNALIARRS